MKEKTCKSCGAEFQPFRSLQRVCSPICAINLDHERKKEAFKRETRSMKKAMNDTDRGYQLKKAQDAFNKYIRLRDASEPCISCGRHHHGQYHAGHYRSVGSAPELRFEPLNVSKQCQPCNSHLSGNLINYRVALVQKIGIDSVEWIEGPHEAKKYTIDDIKAIKSKYSRMARDLEE